MQREPYRRSMAARYGTSKSLQPNISDSPFSKLQGRLGREKVAGVQLCLHICGDRFRGPLVPLSIDLFPRSESIFRTKSLGICSSVNSANQLLWQLICPRAQLSFGPPEVEYTSFTILKSVLPPPTLRWYRQAPDSAWYNLKFKRNS